MPMITTTLRKRYHLPLTVNSLDKLQEFCKNYPASKNWKALCFVLTHAYQQQQYQVGMTFGKQEEKDKLEVIAKALEVASKNWEKAKKKELSRG